MAFRRWGVSIAACGIVAAALGVWSRQRSLSESVSAYASPVAEFVPAQEEVRAEPLPSGLTTLRVQFGSKREGPDGKAPTTWDGSVTASGARIHRIRLWQDNPQDVVKESQWTLATRRRDPQTAAERKKGHAAMPLIDSALLVELADCAPDAELAFTTAQGEFRVKVAEISLGGQPAFFLDRLVQVTRTANASVFLTAPTEDDFPAAAQATDGKLYVAYVAFTHGAGFRSRPTIEQEPESLQYLTETTGGDQVLLLQGDGQDWNPPVSVTPPGQDVFGTALAIDGTGRVWVFWGAKVSGAWDLFARSLQEGRWSDPVQLTNEAEADVFPAAACDSEGRVWVTWQTFRGKNTDILAARQEGTTFGKPMQIASGTANEWMPAIAASKDGQVAIAWDTYQKGDYDVFARIWRDGNLGEAVAIDTSREGQMRAAAAFDAENRLWVAYETTPQQWGKDWGPYDKSGVGLYQGRSVSVRVLADGKLHKPAADPADAFAVEPAAGAGAGGQRGGQLAAPRLAADASGRIWLAVRSGRLGMRTGAGTSWYEHLAWYQQDQWSNEIICPNTDGGLDNRPALVALPGGEMVLFGATDGRAARGARAGAQQRAKAGAKKVAGKKGGGQKAIAKAAAERVVDSRWPDPVNSELAIVRIQPPPVTARVALAITAVTDPVVTEPSDAAVAEAKDVSRTREARVELNGKVLRLARGEFHRHTELSGDGGGDGMLTDMWRYALDAVSFDWIGNGDHDNGGNREYPWWLTQKTTDLFHLPGRFTPVYSYERSCNYPDGHRNVVFAQRGVRPLPRLLGGSGQAMDDLPPDAARPHSPDTLLLYRYLTEFNGVCAGHTSGTDMGTDWRDNDRKVEPIVEIYQGCRQNYEMPGAPRSNTADNSIGGWRPLGFISLALQKGYRLGFQSSSDHGSTHISFCNCWVEEPTREGLLEAMRARHVYGSTDNIIADVRCGEHFMGDEFTSKERPQLSVHLVGTRPFAKIDIVRDGTYVYTTQPNTADVRFDWTDNDARQGATSYYYVRGEQEDGELVWASPLWITYEP